MTIEQANAYFASLPEGFAPARQLQEASLPSRPWIIWAWPVRLANDRCCTHGGGAQGCRPRYRQLLRRL